VRVRVAGRLFCGLGMSAVSDWIFDYDAWTALLATDAMDANVKDHDVSLKPKSLFLL
jgi:hypothetical protein